MALSTGYRHGVYVSETPTGLMPPARVDVSLPVIWGTAPVHNLPEGLAAPVNAPLMVNSVAEFVALFGAPTEGEDPHDYTLYEAVNIYIGRYNVCPIICINVFDPVKHMGSEGQPDVSKVTALDIIGGIEAETGKRTGLELVEEIFPRFRLLPGQLLAPGFSGDESVALLLGAKATLINGHFRCTAIADVPASVKTYADVPAWLNDNNLTDTSLQMFFGQPIFADRVEWGSAHLAGGTARRDADNQGIPYWSPSNQRLLANGMSHAGQELHLGNSEVNYLNGQGIVSALNFIGGLKFWGNHTTAYPGITDPKDVFIPVRRMFNWIGNTLVLTAWQKLDAPMLPRHIENVCDTFNVWLNGLVAREYLLGGQVRFMRSENPDSDLMQGISRFHVYLAPPIPNLEINFVQEFEPGYLQNLFGVQEY